MTIIQTRKLITSCITSLISDGRFGNEFSVLTQLIKNEILQHNEILPDCRLPLTLSKSLSSATSQPSGLIDPFELSDLFAGIPETKFFGSKMSCVLLEVAVPVNELMFLKTVTDTMSSILKDVVIQF